MNEPNFDKMIYEITSFCQKDATYSSLYAIFKANISL